MKIEKGKLVSMDYSLYTDGPDGELIEETTAEEPFEFIYGHESMLDKFEETLKGMEAGKAFSVLIKAEDAYGPEQEDAFVEMEKSMFVVDGELDEELIAEGEVVPLQDEDGNEILAVIAENNENTVVVDLNHPLAGVDLYFDGEVLEVREPSEEEWSRIHE
ncbi:MAG: FKBP-type peptidyl-prolyl cis-trans isomerase [Flavobacteriales bacterium]|nr:FKBP-type peptidyl-prolyl cis-trans isomerase [Flavobacteriales bacterium]